MHRLDDAIIFPPQPLAVLPQHIELMAYHLRVVRQQITGVSVPGCQLERHPLAISAYPQGDMRLLHPLRLVDSSPHLVIPALEARIWLTPHSPNDLQSLVQHPEPLRAIEKGVTVGCK